MKPRFIIVVISQVTLVAHAKELAVDSGSTRYIYANRETRTSKVLCKGTVLQKLTSGKNLAFMDFLYVPTIGANMISTALLNKARINVIFESIKIILRKNNVFMKKIF